MKKFCLADLDRIILGKPGPVQWIRGAIFGYIIITIIAHFLSSNMMYQPPRPGYNDEDPSILKLSTRTSKTISAIMYQNPKAAYTVLYSHGNATDIGYTDPFCVTLRDAGFNVITYDYQGYGTSEGSPSETRSYDDINAAYHYLTEELMIPEESIILYGSSVGAGPTVDLATRSHPAGVILESPFLSAYRVMTHIPLFAFDKYDNIKKIPAVTSPLLFIHGEKDRTIGQRHGRGLFKRANEPKTFHSVIGAGHNSLFSTPGNDIIPQIKKFMASLSDA